MIRRICALAAALMILSGCAFAAGGGEPAAVPDELAELLNGIRRDSGAVCGTLVLSRNGRVFLTWSFGGVDETTCFRIASVTKWVTAIGLMTLVDDGRLDLAVAQGKSLLLANSFPAPDFTTAEYYLFLSLNTLQLNPEISTVCWLSPLSEEDKMSLYRYFKSVVQL